MSQLGCHLCHYSSSAAGLGFPIHYKGRPGDSTETDDRPLLQTAHRDRGKHKEQALLTSTAPAFLGSWDEGLSHEGLSHLRPAWAAGNTSSQRTTTKFLVLAPNYYIFMSLEQVKMKTLMWQVQKQNKTKNHQKTIQPNSKAKKEESLTIKSAGNSLGMVLNCTQDLSLSIGQKNLKLVNQNQ